MEPEQASQEQTSVEQGSKFENLRKVTPLSKYLAMALFIILPFFGGYIGYQYAPVEVVERVVTTEVETEKEDTEPVETSPVAGEEIPVVDTVDIDELWGGAVEQFGVVTTKLLQGERPQYRSPEERHHSTVEIFDHYRVSYTYPSYLRFYHAGDADLLQTGVRYLTEEDNTIAFATYFHRTDYCHLSRCEKEAIETFSHSNREWEYVGSSTYCDVGQCGTAENLYRTYFGDGEFVLYIRTMVPIHEGEGELSRPGFSKGLNIKEIFESLSAELLVALE